MARVVKIIKNAQVKFGAVATPIVPGALTDYSCQVTEARVTASANTTDIDATFCEPASSINVPSSFTLELNGLQDWGAASSFSEYAFKNDAVQVAFALYLDGSTNPCAMGIVSMAAGDFGGVAGEPLTFSASLPILGYPTILDASGVPLRPGATAGVPGSWTPAGSSPPATVAALIAGTPNAVTASPATAWTTGQYVQTGTAGVPGQAHWSGTAWVAGAA
jgi:hypothetical protein